MKQSFVTFLNMNSHVGLLCGFGHSMPKVEYDNHHIDGCQGSPKRGGGCSSTHYHIIPNNATPSIQYKRDRKKRRNSSDKPPSCLYLPLHLEYSNSGIPITPQLSLDLLRLGIIVRLHPCLSKPSKPWHNRKELT